MEIVVRLRPETARVFQGNTGARNATGRAAEVATVLRRFGVNLRPQHPSVSDPGLGSYFIVSGALSSQAEQIAEALRGLGEVEAAYVKPPAELP